MPKPPTLIGIKFDDKIAVWCPFCCSYHLHGCNYGEADYTPVHKIAHCQVESNSPFLDTGYLVLVLPRVCGRKVEYFVEEPKLKGKWRSKEEPWISAKEAAKYLGMSVKEMRSYLDTRIISPSKRWKMVQFRRSELDHLFKRRKVKSNETAKGE